MDDVTHTPGPWFVSKRRNRICTETGVIVAQVWNPQARLTKDAQAKMRAQSDATARLIAAAPDMLEALRNCAAILPRYQTAGKTTGDDEECAAVLEQVTEAIATAEGRQP